MDYKAGRCHRSGEETVVGIFGTSVFCSIVSHELWSTLSGKQMGRPQDYNQPFDETDLSAMK